MRRIRPRRGFARLASGLSLLFVVGGAAADDRAPRVLAVRAGRQANDLTCRVGTDGLPGERSLKSMQGGLPAGVDLVIDLIDDHEQVVQRREVAFRLAFDLWEEVFRLDGPALQHRFGSIDSLRAALREMGPLPVVPIERLAPGRRFRLRVDMLEQVIAPSQRARVGRILAGEADAAREGTEHETSISLG